MKKICNICQNKKFDIISKKIRDSEYHKIIQCCSCKHIQIFPIPEYDENRKFYDNDTMSKNLKINSIEKIRQKSKFDTEMNVKLVEKLASKTDKILEIGSGYGFFLYEMNKKGYDIQGIEISKLRRIYSKKISNVYVFDHDLTQSIPDMGKFDIIILFAVMEYISDPIGFLSNIRQLLTARGKLIIKSPNANDIQLKLNPYYGNWFWQRAHINYLTDKIIKLLLKKTNFKNIKIYGLQRYSIENMFMWKFTNQPQLQNPTYSLNNDYQFIDDYYKQYLEKRLVCDTLITIAKK